VPRSRSIAIQSERVRRRSARALTSPANWIAPPNRSNFSVIATGSPLLFAEVRPCRLERLAVENVVGLIAGIKDVFLTYPAERYR
jgi:hypothetical protein